VGTESGDSSHFFEGRVLGGGGEVVGTFLTLCVFCPVAPVRTVRRGDEERGRSSPLGRSSLAFLSRFTRQLAKIYEKQQLEHIIGIDEKYRTL
jgi:hypothetical protein